MIIKYLTDKLKGYAPFVPPLIVFYLLAGLGYDNLFLLVLLLIIGGVYAEFRESHESVLLVGVFNKEDVKTNILAQSTQYPGSQLPTPILSAVAMSVFITLPHGKGKGTTHILGYEDSNGSVLTGSSLVIKSGKYDEPKV